MIKYDHYRRWMYTLTKDNDDKVNEEVEEDE
jgi:hypothetical protein